MEDEDEQQRIVASSSKPPSLLPIAKYERQLVYTIEKYPITILIGHTGSGKTTQLPQFLRKAGWCADGRAIAVTQVIFDPLQAVASSLTKPFPAKKSSCNVCSSTCRRRGWLQPWPGSWLHHTLRRCHVREDPYQIPYGWNASPRGSCRSVTNSVLPHHD